VRKQHGKPLPLLDWLPANPKPRSGGVFYFSAREGSTREHP